MWCGANMRTIINPFIRKILGLDSFGKVMDYVKAYYKKWIPLATIHDPTADDYYDDMCDYFEKQKVPYNDFSFNEGDRIERVLFVWTDGRKIYSTHFGRTLY